MNPMNAFRFGLVGVLLAVGLCLSSCNSAGLDKSGPYAGDQVLYSADQSVATAYDVIDLFLSYDLANKATVSASAHAFAEKLRAQAPGWFKSYTNVRQAYVASPTPDNRLQLTNALAVLTAAVAEARTHIAEPVKAVYWSSRRWHSPLFA